MGDKKYYWLRLKKDFFKRHDIQVIENMPNGKDYVLFYLKLLCESVDHEGNLRFNEEIPYNEEMLSAITNTNIDTVRNAIKLFAGLHMIEVLDDGTLYMSQVEKMIGGETYWAERKRIQKARKLEGEFENIKILSAEQFALPSGETRFIDEKRYGGNGKRVWDRAKCKCEVCGSSDNLCIHHNNGYSNEMEDLGLVCRSCHRKIESGEIEIGKFPISPNPSPICPSKSKRNSKELELEKNISISGGKSTRFTPPTLEEVQAYCIERGNNVDAERFIDFYSSKGWMVGKNKMKDWKAAVRNWEKREPKKAESSFDTNDFFSAALNKSYGG